MVRSTSKIALVALAATTLGGLFSAAGCSSTGNVSLGKNGDGLTDCAKSECGPEPGVASTICADGTTGGFTGRCVKAAGSSSCGWEIRSCGDPTCTPPAPTVCPDGTVTVAGCTKDPAGGCTCAGTTCPGTVCSSTECGPEPYGMPNYKCADGSTGGPVCDASSGTCGWHIRSCPTDADGGVADAISTDAISADGGVIDGVSSCFDPTGTIPYTYRRCGTDAECTTAKHQTNCCGDKTVTGINASEASTFATCEAAWDATFPGCGCAEGPDKTDDGLTITDPTKVVVHCVGSSPGATGTCETTLAP